MQELLLEMLSGSPKTADQIIGAHTMGCHDCLVHFTATLAVMCALDLVALRGGPEEAVTFLKSNLIEDQNGLDDVTGPPPPAVNG